MSEAFPHSVHSFMLPLKWDYLPPFFKKGQEKGAFDYDTRTNLAMMNQKLSGGLFKRKFFKLDNDTLNYNEISYFHGYVVRSIFDLQLSDEPNPGCVSNNKTLLYYEVEVNEQSRFIITANKNTYELALSGISLHVFNTGIAIITYNLANYTYPHETAILEINEFSRRFYPPFLSGPDGNLTAIPKTILLASEICIELPGVTIREDFSGYDTLSKKDTHHYKNGQYVYGQIITLPNHVVKLFSRQFVFGARYEKGDTIRMNTIGDDRMFFQCWYGNNQLSYAIRGGKKQEFDPNNNFWFAFTNGDCNPNSLGLKSRELQKKYAEERTYRLWEGYGSFYGFTRDSFVCLSQDLKTNSSPDLRNQMKTLYYHMGVLTLAQRASVLRFSAEISSLTDLGKTDPKVASRLIEKLYLNYIEFINKIFFREITPQLQGIEMYARMQAAMNIRDDIKDLDEELAELHNFSMMVKQDIQNNQSYRLTKMASWFLPASLAFGVLGANFYADCFPWDLGQFNTVGTALFWGIAGLLPSLLLYLLIRFKIIKL